MLSPYNIKEIAPGVFRLEEYNLGTCYLVKGATRGLLIDTGTGIGDLRGLVEKMLSTPYDVVLTHGHGDHAGGIHQFTRVYVQPEDMPMVRKVSLDSRKGYARRIQETYPESKAFYDPEQMICENPEVELLPLPEEGFDLGDKKITWFSCPGHTPGSVNLLSERDGVLFSGDNHQHLELIMMPGEDRMAVIRTWLEGCRKAGELREKGAFTALCGGHEELTPDLLEDLIACGEGILSGKIQPEEKTVHIFHAPFASFGKVNIMYLAPQGEKK